MFRLTLRDLQFRSTRFVLVTAGTTVVFALLLLMNGLSNHFYLEPVHATDAIGADAWVLPDGVSSPFTTAGSLDPAVAGGVTGAQRADPLVIGRAAMEHLGETRDMIVIGYQSGGVVAPSIVAGRAPSADGEVVLDDSAGAKPGERVRLGASTFTVTGLIHDATVLAGVPFALTSIPAAQAVTFGGRPIISAIVTRGHPTQVPGGFTARTPSQIAAATREPLKRATKSIDLIKFLLWLVSAMIIGGVVYLSSMERRRDFAVLKAIGADTRSLLTGLAAQSVFVALAASVFAVALQVALQPVFPLRVEVSTASLVKLPALAVVVALAASAAGMRRVAGTDPSAAFAAQGA